jgi:hypothetical protein
MLYFMTNLGQNWVKKQENPREFYVTLRVNSVDVSRPLKLRQRRDNGTWMEYIVTLYIFYYIFLFS